MGGGKPEIFVFLFIFSDCSALDRAAVAPPTVFTILALAKILFSFNCLLFQLNCNRQYGDLGRAKRYACFVAFTQVAGVPTEVQSRDCKVVDAEEDSDEQGNCQTDAIE